MKSVTTTFNYLKVNTSTKRAKKVFKYSPPIETLNLSKRSLNALNKSGIYTIQDLKDNRNTVADLPGIGKKSLDHILKSLDKSI